MRKFSLNGRLVQYRQMSAGIESYIWRTMGDKRVRPAHRARAGVVYKWSNPPEGGHPGQAVRCRCVAQPLIDESSFKLVPQKNSYTEQNQNDIIKSRLQYLKENKKLTTKNIKKVVPRNAKEKGSGRTQALKKSYKLSLKSMPKYVKSSHNKVPRLPEGEYNLTVRRQVQNRHLQKNSYTTAEESAKINTGNKPRWAERDKLKILSKEEYSKLRELADSKGIYLSGVKNFDGSPKVIEESIKTLADLQKQFPKVATGNKKLTLALSYNMDDEDFAITKGRIITLNANAFRDIEKLQTEYKKLVDEGWFVKGTDYRAIIYHEFGHVVAKTYNLNPMKIACAITGLEQLQTMQFIQENISEYAGSVPKGTEIISEVFSDMSTETPNEFSQKFYSELKEL